MWANSFETKLLRVRAYHFGDKCFPMWGIKYSVVGRNLSIDLGTLSISIWFGKNPYVSRISKS